MLECGTLKILMHYEIEGDNLEIVRVRLDSNDSVYAEAGKMVYKTPNVEWRSAMRGKGITGKLIGGLKSKLTGESLFFTHFDCPAGGGEVGFAGDFPGRVRPLDLQPGRSVLVQRRRFRRCRVRGQIGHCVHEEDRRPASSAARALSCSV